MGAVRESCAVCWREYAENIVPVLATCGHTYCRDCSTSIRRCPLCRKKLPSGYVWPINYALASFVEKVEQVARDSRKQKVDMQVQTDFVQRRLPARLASPKPLVQGPNSVGSGMSFRICRDQAGGIKGFHVNFK